MVDPLKYDEAIVKEFGIKDNYEMDPIYKVSFARTQLEEIKKFLWRERIELLLAEGQAQSEIEALAASAAAKVAEHRTNIKGVCLSIDILEQFVEKLSATVTD